MATIYETLQSTGLPCVYSHWKTRPALPYLVYVGDGQSYAAGDDTYNWTRNRYHIEYYYNQKNEAAEQAIEACLLTNQSNYTKSEDIYIDDEDMYVIYYYV